MTVYIDVEQKVLNLCGVKAKNASELDREQTASLMNWCDYQPEDYWEGLNLQDILNVYRVSAEWETWESWAQEEPAEAIAGWNRAVPHKQIEVDTIIEDGDGGEFDDE